MNFGGIFLLIYLHMMDGRLRISETCLGFGMFFYDAQHICCTALTPALEENSTCLFDDSHRELKKEEIDFQLL